MKKAAFIAVLIAGFLSGCTVTTAKINSGSVGESDQCDNSVSVKDGVFTATSVCYKDGQPVGKEIKND